MDKEIILSPEGYKRLEEELEHMKTVRRREVAERIKQAREFGDISENSEYEDAKNEQAFIEGRILMLEEQLRNARVIDVAALDPHEVGIGTRVKVKDLETGEVETYTVVGSTEADPFQNRISSDSPVGQALVGHRVGDVVEVTAPVGIIRYEILAVER
jgi:transcription elongation factor GreA